MATWLDGYTRNPKQDGGSHLAPVDKLVVHSTETGGLPGYPGTAPQITLNPKTEQCWQHSPLDRAGRALARPRGSGQTNRAGVIQVEVIGTCDRGFARKWGYLYLPDMNDRQIAWLGAELGKISRAARITVRSSVTWRQYPSSYGNSPVRMGSRDFYSHKGWLGHQHVPWNTHGDAGDIPIAALLAAAGNPTLKEILDMDLNDAIPNANPDAKAAAKAAGKPEPVTTVQNLFLDTQANAFWGAREAAQNRAKIVGYGQRTQNIENIVKEQAGEIKALRGLLEDALAALSGTRPDFPVSKES